MKTCLDCGNTRVFREAQIEWQKVTYDEVGEIENADTICHETAPEGVRDECGKCDSINLSDIDTLPTPCEGACFLSGQFDKVCVHHPAYVEDRTWEKTYSTKPEWWDIETEPRCDECGVHTEDAHVWCGFCGNCIPHCSCS